MAESDNDSLSVDDLLAAFGGPSPKPEASSERKSSPAKSTGPSMSEDEMDLLSALGLAPSGQQSTASTPSASSAKRSASEMDRRQRESFKDAARREQQIRAQQWQQELRRREARIARTQTANGEEAEAFDTQYAQPADSQEMPFIEEGGLSKKPSQPEIVEGGFEQEPPFERVESRQRRSAYEKPPAYEPRQIPEPSFLGSRQSSQSIQPLQPTAPSQPVQADHAADASAAVAQAQFTSTEQTQPVSQRSFPQQDPQPSQQWQQAQPQFPSQFQRIEPLGFQQESPASRDEDAAQPVQPEVSSQPLPAFEQRSGIAPLGSSQPAFQTGGFSPLEPLGTEQAAQAFDVDLDTQTDMPVADVIGEGHESDQAYDAEYTSEEQAFQNDPSIAEQPQVAPAPAAQGVVKRAFFPQASAPSQIQRLDEGVQTPESESVIDKEGFVERRQVPLSASTDALSTGMLGSIQPMQGMSVPANVPEAEQIAVSESAFSQEFQQEPSPLSSVENADVFPQTQPDLSEQGFDQVQPQAQDGFVQAPQEAVFEEADATIVQGAQYPPDQQMPVQQESFAAQQYQTGQFVDGQMQAPAALDAYQEGFQENYQESFAVQQPYSGVNPIVGAQPQLSDDELEIQRNNASSKRNNILGIVLIVVAVLCAVMAIGMLSGLFNMAPSTPAASSSSAASSGAVISDSQAQPNTSEAVYSYVVRGVDGTTHEAIETATFNADGYLEGSSIEIEVDNADVANSLLEQLKSEFGSSVLNSEANDEHVLINLDINRDDLTKEAYTELLLANMTEFKQIS